jgi:hypothetical protein
MIDDAELRRIARRETEATVDELPFSWAKDRMASLMCLDRSCQRVATWAKSGGGSRGRAYGRDLGFRWAGSSRMSIILRAQ